MSYVPFTLQVVLLASSTSAFYSRPPLRKILPPLSALGSRPVAEFTAKDFVGARSSGDITRSPEGTIWPYEPRDMVRQNEASDEWFYDYPRIVTHIDDLAIDSLRNYYSTILEPNSDVLDVCSSWISHLPEDLPLGRVSGLGMNEDELQQNKQLTDYAVKDLNVDPVLPYDDASFDYVFCVVSVDYLTRPQQIFKEFERILRPGGISVMSFSNRCFASKVVAMWLESDDYSRMKIVGSYYHYSSLKWIDIQALDIGQGLSLAAPIGALMAGVPSGLRKVLIGLLAGFSTSDPMYVVRATKSEA